MKRVLMIILAAMVMLPMMAQVFGEQTDEMPQVVFQSTSVMQSSGSAYSANPLLDIDGTAVNPVSSNGPRKAAMEEASNPGTPGSGGTQLPVGDGLWVLMALALAFGGFVALRRRKA